VRVSFVTNPARRENVSVRDRECVYEKEHVRECVRACVRERVCVCVCA